MSVAAAIRAGRAFVELGARDEKFHKAMSNAEKRLNAFATSVGKLGAASIAVGGAVLGGLGAAAKLFADSADSMDTMATKTGMSVEAISELALGVKQANVEMGSLESGVARMQKVLAGAMDGDAGSVQALADLGLTIEELQGLHPDQQFERIADGIAAIADPAKKTAAAMGVFGRSGADLIPLLNGGAKGLQDMRARARELGLTMSTDSAKAGAQLADAFDELQMVTARTAAKIGEAFAPAMKAAIDIVGPLIAEFGKFVSQNPAVVMAVGALAAGAVVLGSALVGVAVAAKLTAIAIGVLTSPVVLIGAAIGVAVGALLYFTGTLGTVGGAIKSAFSGAFEFVSGVMTSISQALKSGDMALAGEIGLAALEVVWRKGLTSIIRLWDWFIKQVSKAGSYLWAGLRMSAELAMAGLQTIVSLALDVFAGGIGLVADALAGVGLSDTAVRNLANAIQTRANSMAPDTPETIVSRANTELEQTLAAADAYRSPALIDAETNLAKAQERLADAQKRAADAQARADAEAAEKARMDALFAQAERGYQEFNAAMARRPQAQDIAETIGEAFEQVSSFGGVRSLFGLTDAGLDSLRSGATGQVLERIASKIDDIKRTVENQAPGTVTLG